MFLVATVLSSLYSWTPSYWSDEAATLRAARLPWATFFDFVHDKDAVHLVYYSFMHVWIRLFGEAEFVVRLPSAVAVGLAAAGLFLLVGHFSTTKIAVTAAIIFAVLPRVTFAGADARSYAFSVVFAVGATLVLVALRTTWRWLPYWALASLLIATFAYGALIVLVHGAWLVLRKERTRRSILAWAVCGVLALLCSTPILVLALGQQGQIAWMSTQPLNAWTVLVEPVFERGWPACIAVLLVVAIWLVLGRRSARRNVGSGRQSDVLLYVLWIALPTGLLILGHLLVTPMYLPRYLTLITPAAAALAAVAIHSFSRRYTAAALAVIIVATIPAYVAQCQVHGKPGGTDLAEIANFMRQHAGRGDAFVLGNSGVVSLRARQAIAAYPGAFSDLDDIAFDEPYWRTGTYSDKLVTSATLRVRLADADRVWEVGDHAAEADLYATGLRPVYRGRAGSTTIKLFERR